MRYQPTPEFPRNGYAWREDEDNRLRSLVRESVPIQQASLELGRSQGSCYQRAKILGIRIVSFGTSSRSSPRYWTPEEDAILRANEDCNVVAVLLPHRTVGSIWQRRNKLRDHDEDLAFRGESAPGRVVSFDRIDGRPSLAMHVDALRRQTAPRSIVAWIQGDPPPGYSALDRRHQSSATEPALGRDADQTAEAVT